MTTELRVLVEQGPRGKRCVALAADWPGLASRRYGAPEHICAGFPRRPCFARGLDEICSGPEREDRSASGATLARWTYLLGTGPQPSPEGTS
ncbi:MAG TPA: hypothetical protein VFM19_11070 [Candidatus Limnocylindria bacterium]|nr:hypothetical protein [Candidatus Limnocylindria bacterium]